MPGRHRKDYSPYEGPPEEREQFIRDNAVAVADSLMDKIGRQREQLTRQDKQIAALKRENAELRQKLGESNVMEGTQLREQEAAEGNRPPLASGEQTETQPHRET